jgi:hypothetical protein
VKATRSSAAGQAPAAALDRLSAAKPLRRDFKTASEKGVVPSHLRPGFFLSASRGKAMRAEPISLLYEKGRVLHRRGLDQLEAEMMSFSREWDRAVDGSPNRLDAAVWGLTRLSKVITNIPIA